MIKNRGRGFLIVPLGEPGRGLLTGALGNRGEKRVAVLHRSTGEQGQRVVDRVDGEQGPSKPQETPGVYFETGVTLRVCPPISIFPVFPN